MTANELHYLIYVRRKGIVKARNVVPIGIVMSREYYETLRGKHPWKSPLTTAHQRGFEGEQKGDMYQGLDVAITKSPNTLIVY